MFWKEIKMLTESEQEICIQPTPELDGIQLSFGGVGEKLGPVLYIENKEELDYLVQSITEVMIFCKLQTED